MFVFVSSGFVVLMLSTRQAGADDKSNKEIKNVKNVEFRGHYLEPPWEIGLY